ncbi:MAG: hypothetical protein IKS21_00690 [Oscillospiraceae bacterium]|nr:hypothetical protein [Oscillospiraceae bacterium]
MRSQTRKCANETKHRAKKKRISKDAKKPGKNLPRKTQRTHREKLKEPIEKNSQKPIAFFPQIVYNMNTPSAKAAQGRQCHAAEAAPFPKKE